MPSNPNIAGGLDLGALAAQGTAESAQRSQGSQAAMNSYLQSMLAEQSGLLQGGAEAQNRDQQFLRAQAMLEEALARREAALQEAQARAEMAFQEQQGNANRSHAAGESADDRAVQMARIAAEQSAARAEGDDWYAKQRFQTDENIRQAEILAKMERAQRNIDRKAEMKMAERAEQPRLSDFGKDEVSAFRGLALQNAGYKSKTNWIKQAALDNAIRNAYAEYGAQPAALKSRLSQIGDDEDTSIALWRLFGASGG